MKVTRANVEQFAKEKGLTPLQIDGIPEGFIWKEADMTVSGTFYPGDYILFLPLREWVIIRLSPTFDRYDLLQAYNREMRYGQKQRNY